MPMPGRAAGVGFIETLRGSCVLAVVLTAVAVAGGWEESGSCSRFVSVNSSLDGVNTIGGSEGGSSGVSFTDDSAPARVCESVGGGGRRSSDMVSSMTDCGRAVSC